MFIYCQCRETKVTYFCLKTTKVLKCENYGAVHKQLMVRNIDTYSCTFRGIYGVNKIASLATSPNKTMLSVHESVSGRVIFRLGDENG